MTADEVAAKLNGWYPMWTWAAAMSRGYCTVWITATDPRGYYTERVARARSWRAALISAKTWAWKQVTP